MSYSFLSKMIEKGHRPLDVKNGDERLVICQSPNEELKVGRKYTLKRVQIIDGLHTIVYLKEFGDKHPGFGAGLFGEIN